MHQLLKVGEGNIIMLEKVKKIIVITCMISLSLIGSLSGGMTSYAKGPGEANTTETASTQTNINITINTYTKSVVAGLGSWVQESNLWKFKLNAGGYAVNSWIESLTESGTFYYVNESGVMLTNTTTPDGYTVDANGVWRGTVVSNSDESTSSTSSDTGKKNSSGLTDEEMEKIVAKYELGLGNYQW